MQESLADEVDLVLVDPSFLEGKRTRRVDPKHSEPGEFDERTKILVDETPVASERGQEAAQDIVERHIVIARNAEHFVARMLQPFEEPRTRRGTVRCARAA